MPPLDDPVLVFTVLTLVMLIAPLISERLRIPELVLLLVAGALLGPNGSGLLARNTAVTLFGTVGLLYIMFLAGLEIDLHRFAATRRRSAIFGVLSFVIPQGAGMLAGRFLLGFDWTTSALFATLFAHTLLAYPVASRLGIARTEPVVVTVGATIITDTLALLVLAVVADSTRGVELGLTFWFGLGAGMISLVALIWWGIPRLTRWFFERASDTGGARFLFVLVTVCGCAYLSHFAKMEPIIGAFLAGAAFSRLIPEQSVLMSRVVFVGNTLFIPFFLISVGMLSNPAALVDDPRSWLVALTLIGLVVATKYAAAWIAGSLFGYDADAKKVMFGLSVVQAATTLAAVLVGYELKIFDETVLNGAITMIIVTALLGSWVVDRYGRRIAGRIVMRSRAESQDQRLLVSVVEPASATRLLDLAFLLRDRALPGDIHPVTIVRDDSDSEEAVTRGETVLAHCLSHAAAADIAVHPSVRVDTNVADGLVRAVKELRSNMVLIGWEGSGYAARSITSGYILRNLLESCPSQLCFCRLTGPLHTTLRVIVPFFTLAERRLGLSLFLREIKYLSRQIGAELVVVLTGREPATLRRMIEAAAPARPVTFIEVESQAEARTRLFAEIRSGDLILIPAERRNGPLWSPGQDPLLERLAAGFPENNLLVTYPRSVTGGGEEWTDSAVVTTSLFALVPVELTLGISLEAALHRMTEEAFGHWPKLTEEAFRLLTLSASSYPLEVTPGVVLLHEHSAELTQTTLIVGCGNWTFPGIEGSARILLALLSPKDQPPDRHLKSLAELARRFNDAEFTRLIAETTSAKEISQLFATPAI